MKFIHFPTDPNLLVGSEDWSDAAIYRLRDDLAIVQSVDFFTPIVDNPYDFGQIAIANSLSDIYSTGAKPILALNIVCFPIRELDKKILQEILTGGADKLAEAGALLVGGHSVEDPEIKYGAAVTGVVHPEKFVTNRNAKVGDLLILTKPIGTGILSTALKGKLLDPETTKILTDTMAKLNKKASELMMSIGVNACTDITGFGLIGHALEMAKASKVTIKIFKDRVPVLPKVFDFASIGIVPVGGRRNVNFCSKLVDVGNTDPILLDILSDPQTSGGLLISVEENKAQELLKRMKNEGIGEAEIIGEVVEKGEGKVVLS